MTIQSSRERQFFYYTMLLAKGIGPVKIREIVTAINGKSSSDEQVGSDFINYIQRNWQLSQTDLPLVYQDSIQKVLTQETLNRFEELHDLNRWIICPGDTSLPQHYWEISAREKLQQMFIATGEPPPEDLDWTAVIGPRDTPEAGLASARAAALNNVRTNTVTVSGGAKGVDNTATMAAQNEGGWTVVIPVVNANTIQAARKQLIVFPYPPGQGFRGGLAMARNKIIVALSNKIIVAYPPVTTEGKQSGTQDAIDYATKSGFTAITHGTAPDTSITLTKPPTLAQGQLF